MPQTARSQTVRVDTRARDAADEVREFGSTVLRQVWPAAPLAKIRQAIVDYSALRAARVAAGEPRTPTDKMYATHGVGTFAALLVEGLLGTDLIADLFAGSFYHELCAAYFEDDEFYAGATRLGFRNHDPLTSDKSFIPYHQDSYTQDQRVPRVLNCWIPLDPGAGVTSPGLEVVRNPCMADFPRKDFGLKSANAAYDFITIDRDKIVEVYGESFLAPAFEIGDGLVFSENVIHRTYVTPQMTRPRINFELRVFTPKCLAPGATLADLGPSVFRIA